jgi:membrane protein YqaA with SNARE-associated domain
MRVLRSLYNWMMKQAGGKHAEPALIAVSFAESSFFPVPPDIMLIPMIIKQPEKAWRFATVCTLASVAGALLGYAIGYFLSPVGMWMLDLFGYGERLEDFKHFMEKWGVWVILAKGLTPIPFKLVTIASGLASFNIFAFVLSCAVTRGARFFLVAWLVKRFGAHVAELVEKRLYLAGTIAVVVIVLGIVALKFIPH